MPTSTARSAERIVRICLGRLDERDLRAQVIHELRSSLGFDAYAWLLTDPRTWVGTAPLAEVPEPEDLPRLIGLKYRTTVNRWTTLPPRRGVLLSVTTGGRLVESLIWRELLKGYGVVDIASVSFRDRYGSWGFLDLWRCAPQPSFTDADASLLTQVAAPITSALRRAQARLFTGAPLTAGTVGPAVLVLDDGLQILQQTAPVDQHLRALLPTDPDLSPVPAAALNVAAQLQAVESGADHHPPSARAHLTGGPWISIRASRLTGSALERGTIAITIETLALSEHVDLFACVTAVTPRERQLLHLLTNGADNATVATSMSISLFTVQDHLKSIYAKSGARTRTELIAQATAGRRAIPVDPRQSANVRAR